MNNVKKQPKKPHEFADSGRWHRFLSARNRFPETKAINPFIHLTNLYHTIHAILYI